MGLSLPAMTPLYEKRVLGGILLLAILHGLIFIAIVPPWQHYDEPGHFEYAWLIANRSGIPEVGDYDQRMRREISASMIEHEFFVQSGFRPNLLAVSEPIWIGISQAGDVPAYYLLVSLPLRLVQGSDITFQLYLGRLVSLVLYTLNIFAAYGIVAQVTRQGSALRWVVPLSLVCMPGFTELMTAVNNDVGAVAFFSFFLWASVSMMSRGLNLWRLGAVLFLAALCAITKSTVLVAVVLWPIPIIFALLKDRWHKKWLIYLALASVCLAALILSPEGAVGWYTQSNYSFGYRLLDKRSDNGSAVMSLPISEDLRAQVYQPLEYNQVLALRGQTVTLGAWIWADNPVRGNPLVIQDKDNYHSEKVEIGTTPQFYAISTKINDDTGFVNVILRSAIDGQSVGGYVYVDDVIFVAGDHMPRSTQQNGTTAAVEVWSINQQDNLLRNPSFEKAWLQVRPFFLSTPFSPFMAYISQAITSISDLSASGWYYLETARNLFQTLWGKFGWGQVLLAGQYTYYLLGLVTAAGIIGAVMYVWSQRRSVNWRIFMFLIITVVIVWAAALMRGIGSLAGQVFIGSARYAFPVMIPTLFMLSVGWLFILTYIRNKMHLPLVSIYIVYWVGFIVLDILSWWTIWHYYSALT